MIDPKDHLQPLRSAAVRNEVSANDIVENLKRDEANLAGTAGKVGLARSNFGGSLEKLKRSSAPWLSSEHIDLYVKMIMRRWLQKALSYVYTNVRYSAVRIPSRPSF